MRDRGGVGDKSINAIAQARYELPSRWQPYKVQSKCLEGLGGVMQDLLL